MISDLRCSCCNCFGAAQTTPTRQQAINKCCLCSDCSRLASPPSLSLSRVSVIPENHGIESNNPAMTPKCSRGRGSMQQPKLETTSVVRKRVQSADRPKLGLLHQTAKFTWQKKSCWRKLKVLLEHMNDQKAKQPYRCWRKVERSGLKIKLATTCP